MTQHKFCHTPNSTASNQLNMTHLWAIIHDPRGLVVWHALGDSHYGLPVSLACRIWGGCYLPCSAYTRRGHLLTTCCCCQLFVSGPCLLALHRVHSYLAHQWLLLPSNKMRSHTFWCWGTTPTCLLESATPRVFTSSSICSSLTSWLFRKV